MTVTAGFGPVLVAGGVGEGCAGRSMSLRTVAWIVGMSTWLEAPPYGSVK